MKAASVVFKESDFEDISSSGKLFAKVEEWLEACEKKDVDLVVFPALIGSLFNSKEYLNQIRKFSLEYKNIAICPGSFLEEDNDQIYHSSCLIINGEVLLWQRQIYLAKWERNLSLSRGIQVEYTQFKGMKIGIVLSTDVFYPQVSRALAMSSVDVVLSPIAIKDEKNIRLQISGMWQNVQQNLFFGVESGFKGKFRGYTFFSRSVIHAPLEMTIKEDGFLSIEHNAGTEKLLISQLDNQKRKEAVRKFNPLAQLNVDFYKSIFRNSINR